MSSASASTHYFVQSRNANWQANAGSLKNRIHTVRRFYLLGQMPEQLILSDTLISLAWLRKGLGVESVALTGSGRSAPIATIAALLSQDESDPGQRSPKVTELHLANYPGDAEAGPSLPGLLREVGFTSLLAAARGSLKVRALPMTSPQPNEPLVDSASEPQQATGMRIVEVDQSSAIVWMRATRWSLPNLGDMAELKFEKPAETQNMGPQLPSSGVDGLRYGVPGVPG